MDGFNFGLGVHLRIESVLHSFLYLVPLRTQHMISRLREICRHLKFSDIKVAKSRERHCVNVP